MENVCKIDGVPSKRCQLPYPKAACVNYKFVLGGKKNEALITTVPVKKNTTTFELTNPVKLTWKIECNATSMYPVPVSITNNSKRVDHMVEAACNSAQQICEIYLNKTVVVPYCTYPIININGETVLLSAIHSMNNLISVSNLHHIDIEWTEMMQTTCSVSSLNYSLVIEDNEKNQTVQDQDVPVQNMCITALNNRNTQRRKLTFNKYGQITPCNDKENNFVFKNIGILKPCVNYTVYVFSSEKGKSTMTEVFKKPLVIQTLDIGGKNLSPFKRDVQNLNVSSDSSSRFELQWEVPASCQKLKNFTIQIEKNYAFVQNVRL
ncbi:uncharacterized protein LOC124188957 [Daphnia pulex]|uniref:uncharacterized protein LOC124188957 n=1 Tax=Daphnia pulex TaxID=6669 RepID=UPI001EDDAF77|nr:uncharacterized protein LOC124188957 [Daphnia pulex]